MKKPLLTTIGLAGACAACCAVPLLVPIISGLSVAGVVGLDWERLTSSREYMAPVLGVTAAFAVALGLWLFRRQRTGKACAPDVISPSNALQASGSCGCSGTPKASTGEAR